MSISGQERMRISIHTSAREVTTNILRNLVDFVFQSTLPQGKWQWQQSWRSTSVPFQSTLPQGKWRRYTASARLPHDFNPHFRKGSDSFLFLPFLWYIYFNPHFRKGSDPLPMKNGRSMQRFQSTLPQGKWRRLKISTSIPLDFNPHFRKGSDGCTLSNVETIWQISIHTSAREVTCVLANRIFINKFQSTLPQGKWRHFHPDNHHF